MTAGTAPSPSPGGPHHGALDGAAAAIRRALGCDGVLIAWYRRDDTIAVGADGLVAGELERAGTGFVREQPGDLGFAVQVAVPMTADDRPVGVVHVLNRSAADRVDEDLAATIAGHVAGALQGDGLWPAPLTARVTQQATLDQLALSADNLTNLIPKLERALGPVFGAVRIGLMFWDDERSVLQMVRGSFGAADEVTASCQLDPRDLPHSIAALVFGLQQTYLINNPAGDPAIRPEYVQAFAIERLLSSPLAVNGRATGILHIAKDGPPFSDADLEQCHDVVPRIAIAVESTRMLMRLTQQREVEAVLSQEAVAIASGTESTVTLQQRLDDLRSVFGASLMAFVPATGDAVVARAGGRAADVDQRLLDEARRERHERAVFRRPRHVRDPGAATLYVPVRVGTRRVGTLATFRDRPESFTKEERQGLSRMADLIAISWAWARYQQQRAALARLEERQRIADDLHDHVTQILFAAQMQLDGILDHGAVPEDARSQASLARAFLIRGDTAIRSVITRLSRPLATGLPDRLHEIVEGIDEEFTVPVQLQISDDAAEASRRAPRAIGDTIVKVAREALVNTAKHAGPCRATVTLDLPATDRLRLRVADTGSGTSLRRKAESHGLTSLRRSVRRHGGWLRVTRGKAGGTVVTASLPI